MLFEAIDLLEELGGATTAKERKLGAHCRRPRRLPRLRAVLEGTSVPPPPPECATVSGYGHQKQNCLTLDADSCWELESPLPEQTARHDEVALKGLTDRGG